MVIAMGAVSARPATPVADFSTVTASPTNPPPPVGLELVVTNRQLPVLTQKLLTDLDALLLGPEAASQPADPHSRIPEAPPPSPVAHEKPPPENTRSVQGTNETAKIIESGLFTEAQLYARKLTEARRFRLENQPSSASPILLSLIQEPVPDPIARASLLELALVAQQEDQLLRALTLFSSFIEKYPDDIRVPEVLLRQGLIYRRMGAHQSALNKFYTVMTRALNMGAERLDYYQRLVLQAQVEIAETHYAQENYRESADFLARLLKLDDPGLHRSSLHLKLIRSLVAQSKTAEMIASARDFLVRYEKSNEAPEVRFLLAKALKQTGQTQEALHQVLLLLESQRQSTGQSAEIWIHWQQRTGNEIANELYKEGDFMNALLIYEHLAKLNQTPGWQLPLLYQIGLVYERLNQPQKAAQMYTQIIDREAASGTNAPNPSLRTVHEMAQWRKNFLAWHIQAEQNSQDLAPRVSSGTDAAAAP
ncbi:MAG TPA: tetratricopeptide repeat protein [Candidatus Paceibacterota bacterium]|nr:tetratricopeptide repeat protein [Candidatus Paceibacterota bacterium]